MVKLILETIQDKKQWPNKSIEEFSLNDEDDQNLEDSDTEENKVSGDGNNTMEQKKFCIDIDIMGARKDELGRTRNQTQEMMSPRNE